MLALLAYIAVACAVWIVAATLMISRRTRMLGKKIALSMAGTFPGMIVSQLLVLPFAGLFLVSMGGTFKLLEPTGITETVLFILTLLGSGGLFGAASLFGCYLDWRIVWEQMTGRSVRTLLNAQPLVGSSIRFLTAKFPILESFLPA